MAVLARQASQEDQQPCGRRVSCAQHQGGERSRTQRREDVPLRLAARDDGRRLLRRVPDLHAPRHRLAHLPRWLCLHRPHWSRRQAPRRRHRRPLPPLLPHVPLEDQVQDLRLDRRRSRPAGILDQAQLRARLPPRRPLLLGPLHVDQRLARPLHLAPAQRPQRPPVRRGRVDVGEGRPQHHRPPLLHLRLLPPQDRQHPRRAPPVP
mmetsp:Transcript_27260/g.51650  ORF Transcript_27260/g.51650 Transcript_27260/m.51650 type:complete len:207 (+) Transcript_27260:492-1112(+)